MTLLLRALLGLLLLLPAWGEQDPPDRNLFGRSAESSLAGQVVVLPIGQKDLTNAQSFRFWQRTLKRAKTEGAKAVVLRLDTPGGIAFDTRDLIMDDFADLQIPLIAWVEREALSAGALIAFSADRIYMAPGTTVGSAALINGTGQEIEKVMRAKLESAFEATMRSVAEKKGRNIDVLRAMMVVDDENERRFGPVTVRKGSLLNLTASEAILEVDDRPLFADGLASSLEEVLEKENLTGNSVTTPTPTGFETLAWWLAAWSPLLIAVGIGAAWFEMKTPGFGIGGSLALLAFGLFFFGNHVAGNLAGYELMTVFLLGIVLVILEIFVLPGGIAGIIGALLVFGSLTFAMVDRTDFHRDHADQILTSTLDDLLIRPGIYLGLGLLGALTFALLLGRYLPHIPGLRGLVATHHLPAGQAPDAQPIASLIGQIGIAMTDLRPSGTVDIKGLRRDAVSRHGLILAGTSVRVLQEGMTLHVEALQPPPERK
ncbi:membrane-bound serine protease (ClpP class) [Haloferula luteola]|uniref:Membrane-bound serine protease (ClpP class) n=1 Tax=Haloferula luteola TaxID=595692 RepID=A0A840VE28_9BACT|nr:NfeD family protein [Haloferula luteola]MBB5352888.1 membrane-bound serine protease (ClpP class) [Haloferula luteola]